MARWYLLRAFKSQIARSITVWVFGSLLAIELVILIPSYLKRERELLAHQEFLVITSIEAALLNRQTKIGVRRQDLIETVLKRMRSRSMILGSALYRADGKRLAQKGDPPPLTHQSLTALTNRRSLDRLNQTYDTVIYLDQVAPPFYLAIRHNTHLTQQALNAYVGRMLGMIFLISVTVTLGTMIGVERLVIRPVLYLHKDLLTAIDNIRQGNHDSQFHATKLQQPNELGEVIITFQHMYEQIWQALKERESAHLSEQQAQTQANQLRDTLARLHNTQVQLLQAEKMSGLGQLVAGVAHEINNPISFIHGNLGPIQQYVEDLLHLVQLYQQNFPSPSPDIQENIEDIDLEFIQADLPKLFSSMRAGSQRVREIVLSLRNFSRLDESDIKSVDIHQGLDSTLVLLKHRLTVDSTKPKIQIIKNYAPLPLIECYAGLINQVFMNVLSNAIDVLEKNIKQRSPEDCIEHPSQVTLQTSLIQEQWVRVVIANNGPPIKTEIQQRIFEPFFTTKPIGQGTGMGLSISYQIVTQKHGGQLTCFSEPEADTAFIIEIPVNQKL